MSEAIMSSFRYRPEILQGVGELLTYDLKKYEDWFLLDATVLKKITDDFVKELEKGLTKEGGNVPMNVTWVMNFPNGHEEGRYLTIDMGGTNLRVCYVSLCPRKRDFEQTQRKYKIPSEIKSGTGEQLWNFIADHLQAFMKENFIEAPEDQPLPLAFTFSWPVYQKTIRSGILQRWTKKFNVSGVEGEDIIPQLEAALARKKIPVQVVALLNDTTGTLIASHYRDPHVKVGSIFSTGTNAAYMEECRLIPKLEEYGLPEDAKVIINTEYGAIDNDCKILPLTSFDRQIDEESLRPGTQIYEKMVSGLYIGEMIRLIMLKMHGEGQLFQGQDVTRLRQNNALDATFLSIAELDISEGLDDMREEFENELSLSPSIDEMKVCRYLIGLIATRAARLYACGIAAICKKNKINKCHVGVDGFVFNKYSGFKDRAMQGLRDIFDWPHDEVGPISLNASEDGSGVGAALAAALALKEGRQIGIEQIG
ncbi:Hexokinase [Penicillium argentinense]|uniref:Phosphotransferase n=1 Tax=Penicillium argentinense TaxID=1131581 RepID=A0A9W9G0K7_9EURO|nr:Hexokinase [Penicillium argentinense]KAJ5109894.1 Hexokinase [Penicillium argentinense]